jgi:Arm DNA-binding domain
MTLTLRKIETLTASGKNPRKFLDGHGLYLQVTPAGAKSWLFRYERAGKEHAMGLGPLRLVSLEEARELARDAERLLFKGIDPLEASRAQRATRNNTQENWSNKMKKKQRVITMDSDGKDAFIKVDGFTIAKRGAPGTKAAGTWISLEPGYEVLDGVENGRPYFIVTYKGSNITVQ